MKKNRIMCLSKLVYIITACLAIMLYSGCSSSSEPSQIEIPGKPTNELRLERNYTNAGDTLKIFGKNFGSATKEIVVIIDTMKIVPLVVTDTCVTFAIPKTIPYNTYPVSITIQNEKAVLVGSLIVFTEISQISPRIHVDKAKAGYGDTVRIYGYFFYNKKKDMMVIFREYLYNSINETPIKPISIIDTCITFLIPKNVSFRTYFIGIKSSTFSVYQLSQIVIQPAKGTVNYQPNLPFSKVLRSRSAAINGRNFGNDKSKVTIYLDNTAIIPQSVSDTTIIFTVPNVIGTYSVSMKIYDDEIKDFAKIEVVDPLWNEFTSATVTMRVHTVEKHENNDSLYQTTINQTFSVVGKFKSEFKDNKIVYDYHDGTSSSHSTPDQGKFSSAGGGVEYFFQAKIDTVAKSVTDFNTIFRDYNFISGSFNGTYCDNTVNLLKFSSAKYTETAGGIEVIISGNDLAQLTNALVKSIYRTQGTGFNMVEMNNASYVNRTTVQPPFANDDFVKIVLLR